MLNVPDESRRREWAGRFLLLGGLRYDKMMLVKLLEDHSMLTLSDLRESSFYELILEEGMEKGIEKGIERGRREGEAALLRRQLERRFGSLPSWALERINRADRATVEAWGERVLDAAGISLEDFLT